MKKAEADFKALVLRLHNEGIYPGPTAINRALGRDSARMNTINGRETRWRREVFREHRIKYQRPYQIPDPEWRGI